MSSYAGRYAELYDLFYSNKQYKEEASFIHLCLQTYSKGDCRNVLELACGTGSHAFEMEKLGYDIIATDYSEDMLVCAHRKAAVIGSKVKFERQDMCNIAVSGGPFDAVLCLFDSIGYAVNNKSVIQVLENVNHHLRPNGLFVLEFWHSAAMLAHYEPLRIRRCDGPHGEIIRISESTLDYQNQTCTVSYTVFDPLPAPECYIKYSESHQNRFFPVSEMSHLLQEQNLLPIRWYAGYDSSGVINDKCWHIVVVAQKTVR